MQAIKFPAQFWRSKICFCCWFIHWFEVYTNTNFRYMDFLDTIVSPLGWILKNCAQFFFWKNWTNLVQCTHPLKGENYHNDSFYKRNPPTNTTHKPRQHRTCLPPARCLTLTLTLLFRLSLIRQALLNSINLLLPPRNSSFITRYYV